MKSINILKKNTTLKGVLFSSVSMAFAGLGDALLYSVLPLFVGSYLIKIYSIKTSFIVLGILSFLGVLFAFILPNIKKETSKISLKKVLSFSALNILTFFTSFIIDGVLVVTISKLLFNYSINELVVVVSGYLLFRKLCSAVISVFSGWLSDRFDVLFVFKVALVFVLGSLLFILTNYIEVGIVIAFLFNSVIVAMLPSVALKLNDKNKLTTLTSITTWWDIGAATGTFLGLYLIHLIGYPWLFGVLFGLLLFAILIFLKKSASFSKSKHL